MRASLINKGFGIFFFFLVGNVCVCARVGWEDWKAICLILLCLELEAETKLVATSVDVLAIKESREGQLDACRNRHIGVSHA